MIIPKRISVALPCLLLLGCAPIRSGTPRNTPRAVDARTEFQIIAQEILENLKDSNNLNFGVEMLPPDRIYYQFGSVRPDPANNGRYLIAINVLNIKDIASEAVLAVLIGHELSHVILGHLHFPDLPYISGHSQFAADSLGVTLAERAGYRSTEFISMMIVFLENRIRSNNYLIRDIREGIRQAPHSESRHDTLRSYLQNEYDYNYRLERLRVLRSSLEDRGSKGKRFILSNENSWRDLLSRLQRNL